MTNEFPIDLVVTYVDDNDIVWKNVVSQYNAELSPKRFRNWNIFKYWFRGVDQFMPFVRNVFLVVSNDEQVPEWLNKNAVNVILHKDIIPECLLPTFNSTTIEMYLHKISGLAEHFIYSNDDMIPIGSISSSDFFDENGAPIYQLVYRDSARNLFRMQCKNSYMLAAKIARYKKLNNEYFYIRHSMSSMLKSCYEHVHAEAGEEIKQSCTKFREPWNFTQYLFSDYAIMSDKAKLGQMKLKYLTTKECDQIEYELKSKSAGIMCINDTSSVDDFEDSMHRIAAAFAAKYPQKSRFEL